MRRVATALVVLALLASCNRAERPIANATFDDAPIILVSIDTLRSDRLPAYGYSKVATPAIDKFAADAITFDSAWSACPLTLPSHLSVMTGLNPQKHGVRDNIGFRFDAAKSPTLAALLKKNGYATGAAVSAYVLRRTTGFSEGFDDFDDDIPTSPHATLSSLQRHGADTLKIAASWLESHKQQKSFYFAHIYEPHAPYEAPDPFRSQYPDAYDAEVAYADSIVGTFFEQLKASGVYDRALIVLFSDHGEGLMQHGEQEHGILLNREAIQVPLFVKLPKSQRAGTRVAGAVSLLDIFPTILAVAGVTVPPHDGVSLLASADKPTPDRAVFSETMYPRIHLGWSDLRSLATSTHHLIDAPKPELFDLKNDPAETRNVLQEERRVYNRLRKEVDALGKEVALPTNIDPEEAAKLAALGYISATKATAEGDLPDPKDRIGQLEELKKAYDLADLHRFPEAIAELKKLVQLNPSWTDAWSKLGLCYESIGDYDAAVQTYKSAINVSPILAPEFGLLLASVQMKLGQFDEAKKHAELALKTNPGGTHQVLGEIALAQEQLDVAQREAQLTMQHPEYRLQAMLLSARIASNAGRLDQALALIDDLERQVRASGRWPFAYLEFVRGDTLGRMGRNRDAITAFQREVEYFPLNRQAYANLALLQFIEGEARAGFATLELMVQKNPDRGSYLFAAKTLETLQQPAAAAEFRRRAGAAR